MAAITQPGAFGAHSGRRYGSFAGKASGIVAGPYIVADMGVFQPGAWGRRSQVTEIFTPGASDTDVFQPGAQHKRSQSTEIH